MQLNPETLDHRSVYKLLTGVVIPRPIGWVSTLSHDGIPNLAPFSFFNAMGDDPPHVVLGIGRSGTNNKDTLNNILHNGEFVVNMVTEETVERMNLTAQLVEPHIDEFELAGLTPAPSTLVKPARVAESPVALECKLVHHYELEGGRNAGGTIIIGRIVLFQIAEDILLEDYKIDLDQYKPVSRLAGAGYARLGEVFSIKRN